MSHLFKPGQSGNPSGRPKGISAKAKAAVKKYGVDPFEFFAEVLADKKASTRDRIECAKALADRIYGKAVQYTDNTNTEIRPDAIKISFVDVKDKSDGDKHT